MNPSSKTLNRKICKDPSLCLYMAPRSQNIRHIGKLRVFLLPICFSLVSVGLDTTDHISTMLYDLWTLAKNNILNREQLIWRAWIVDVSSSWLGWVIPSKLFASSIIGCSPNLIFDQLSDEKIQLANSSIIVWIFEIVANLDGFFESTFSCPFAIKSMPSLNHCIY